MESRDEPQRSGIDRTGTDEGAAQAVNPVPAEAPGAVVGEALASTVRSQYERYPYPPRDPGAEKHRLLQSSLGLLALVNHLFWGGRREPAPGFRVLDAGCGTGDSAIFMAEQLRGTAAEVVALDFSSASLAVARERAAVRGLTNIRFVQASLLDIDSSELGHFDYIITSGVLHHLESPDAGLAALRSVLKPDGGLGIMVYARYGRAPVYLLQDLFRRLAPAAWPLERRIAAVKETLERLPPDHWASIARETWAADIAELGDASIVDQFLHAQDRAYTVPEVYEWLGDHGLQLARFAYPPAYEPRRYQAGVDVTHLSEAERQATAELLYGRMTRHSFFAADARLALPSPPGADDEAGVPVWIYPDVGEAISRALWTDAPLEIFADGVGFRIELGNASRLILRRVNGRTPVKTILAETLRAVPGATMAQVRARWREVYANLSELAVLGMNAGR